MIAERLKFLRRELKLTKRDLVKELPLNYSTYANYESGFREPNSETLQLLAGYFGVSLDFLLGVSDNRKKADEIAILTDDESELIAKYRTLDAHGREIVDVVLLKEHERMLSINAKVQAA
ncbi:MAG: helix-turn-helix domain-containing protein, partial [Defluviitaleaceae bacterium]|nr:helix-turn-helix domain-containing protein [Defluviitaleaceae bacterium]